ncbi:MAG: hypothetical protein CM1200mP2_10300 [Planctomycetaceae bacterium]|nr:MAG: hypothetical protein CM1200mP2_10300 [Planctomycetaceae bacterium]
MVSDRGSPWPGRSSGPRAILILDEATSAIDASSEDKIHEVLQDFVCDRTVLMITHSMAPGVLELVTRVG